MTSANLGQIFLFLCIPLSILGLLISIFTIRFHWPTGLRIIRTCLHILFFCLCLSSACLLYAFIQNQFQIKYVADYSEIALPTVYKITAFWAGQQGSLLLWALFLAAFSSIALFQHRRQSQPSFAWTLASLCITNGFFAAMIFFAANPFLSSPSPLLDGRGLNPLLQNIGMIAHPPILFLGYAGFTIPFAFLIPSLASKHHHIDDWLSPSRPWLLISWLFLTIGILLGAQWAYVELGWGGYWAWDPVENASLLPWLTSTALLHSLMIQQQRKAFHFWNIALNASSFLLCIFGTYLTRSGVIQSVHAFPESPIGRFFLFFLAFNFLALLILIPRLSLRSNLSSSPQPTAPPLSKESLFLATNIILSLLTAIVLIGTIWPLICAAFNQPPVTITADFYNKIIPPIALLLLALMALGPTLIYGEKAPAHILHRSKIPALISILLTTIIAIIFHLTHPLILIPIFIIAFALPLFLLDSFHAISLRQTSFPTQSFLANFFHYFDQNHRRYGAQLAHLGVLMLMLGIAGSSLFSQKQTLALSLGDLPTPWASGSISLTNLQEIPRSNHTAIVASLLWTNSQGHSLPLAPEVRFYNKHDQQPSREIAFSSTLQRDLYLILAGWDAKNTVTIEALLNPLVLWIWLGGIVASLGAILALIPPFLTQPSTASSTSQTTTHPKKKLS